MGTAFQVGKMAVLLPAASKKYMPGIRCSQGQALRFPARHGTVPGDSGASKHPGTVQVRGIISRIPVPAVPGKDSRLHHHIPHIGNIAVTLGYL